MFTTGITLLQNLGVWLAEHGIAIAVILTLALVARIIGRLFLGRIIRRFISSNSFHSAQAEKQREDTLIQIVSGTLGVLIWIVAVLMLLAEFGVDIGPLLATAGVAGLAIGFGGQYLIRDVVAGLFIILENQYRVGDVVGLDGTFGLVENISIRTATLRDLDGTVHHVPHGVVTKVSNLSKEYAHVNLDITVTYASDLELVIQILNETGEALAQDPQWKEQILKPVQFYRVDAFGENGIVIKIHGDTKPLQQWAVAGELRKRIKIAFDKAGIEIALPQRVVHQAR